MSTKGALRFATGRLKATTKKDITIATPLAMLGIRRALTYGPTVSTAYWLFNPPSMSRVNRG